MGGSDVRARPVAAAPDSPEHPLLLLVPAPDRPLVRARTDALCADPTPDLHSGGLYQRRAVALTVAAMAPWLPIDKLALLLRYCLWTVHLDARLDAPLADGDAGAGLDDVRRAASSVLAALDGTGDGEPELAAILAGLRAHDWAGDLLAGFTEALRDAVSAGVEHAELSRRVAGGQAPPPAERYLALAARDVNYRSVAVALLLLTAAPGVDPFDEAIGHACRAVRLANDLRTAGKDRDDGKLNVLALRTRGGSPVSSRDVERWIDQHVDAHSALLVRASGRGLPAQSRALANSLRMAVGLYRLAP
jgi:hypothetical protein